MTVGLSRRLRHGSFLVAEGGRITPFPTAFRTRFQAALGQRLRILPFLGQSGNAQTMRHNPQRGYESVSAGHWSAHFGVL